MSEENNHIKFTAADIEKYHQGMLSASQRHAMEKAALDDPFLADALEGYAYAEDSSSEIADLDNRLQQRLGNAKLIPLKEPGNRRIPWLRVAVMLVFLAGAAIIASQFLFTKKEKDIAAIENKADSSVVNPEKAETSTPTSGQVITDSTNTKTAVKPDVVGANGNTQVTSPAEKDVATVTPVTIQPAAPGRSDDQLSEKEKKTEVAGNQAGVVSTEKGKVAEEVSATYRDEEDVARKKSLVGQVRAAQKTEPASRMNTFRGRVTDDNNRGLPFANVTNTRDNVGTYTDVSGNFVLTSPDTILDVQVRSLGYDNGYLQLRNTVPNNTVVLKDDNEVVASTLSTRSNSNAKRRQEDNIKVEEPEPADGWDNYDVYLANNLNVPIDFQPKPSLPQEVELSFEVNKNGEPVNIRVERSLCKSCDQEAIRLIKDGPKWNRKTKKRTRVTVAF